MTHAEIEKELTSIEATLYKIHSWVEGEGPVVKEGSTEDYVGEAIEAILKARAANNQVWMEQVKNK